MSEFVEFMGSRLFCVGSVFEKQERGHHVIRRDDIISVLTTPGGNYRLYTQGDDFTFSKADGLDLIKALL